jgi:two-component sensor histidine kinase
MVTYWSQSFDGLAERVADARRFAFKSLGDVPGVELVELVASELAANAVRHSYSGQPGGQFTLHLAAFDGGWRVRVDDAGGPSEPHIRVADAGKDEAGRGLALVAALSSDWGVIGDHYARGVWAKISTPQDEAT